MCVNSVGVSCDDVERFCTIDVGVNSKPEIYPQEDLLQAGVAQRVTSRCE